MDVRAARSHRQNGGWARREYVLFHVRQQAQAGLLREGGTVAAEVGNYVRQVRNEMDTEIAVRFHKPPKATTFQNKK
jgi:hypothetical protein